MLLYNIDPTEIETSRYESINGLFQFSFVACSSHSTFSITVSIPNISLVDVAVVGANQLNRAALSLQILIKLLKQSERTLMIGNGIENFLLYSKNPLTRSLVHAETDPVNQPASTVSERLNEILITLFSVKKKPKQKALIDIATYIRRAEMSAIHTFAQQISSRVHHHRQPPQLIHSSIAMQFSR